MGLGTKVASRNSNGSGFDEQGQYLTPGEVDERSGGQPAGASQSQAPAAAMAGLSNAAPAPPSAPPQAPPDAASAGAAPPATPATPPAASTTPQSIPPTLAPPSGYQNGGSYIPRPGLGTRIMPYGSSALGGLMKAY